MVDERELTLHNPTRLNFQLRRRATNDIVCAEEEGEFSCTAE